MYIRIYTIPARGRMGTESCLQDIQEIPQTLAPARPARPRLNGMYDDRINYIIIIVRNYYGLSSRLSIYTYIASIGEPRRLLSARDTTRVARSRETVGAN